MRLRTQLLGLALATLLPIAVLAGALAYVLVQEQRETFRRGAEERTLAMISAIDAQLGSSVATLQALAAPSFFDLRDLDAVRDHAARVLAAQPDWTTVNLALPSGQQVFNLRSPAGAPLPDISRIDPEWRQRVRDARPWVSGLIMGPVTKRWDFAVRVPVVRDGAPVYVLSAVVRPESISALLKRQDIPAGWVAVVLDRDDRIVARTVDPERSVGQLASKSLREALARTPSGWFRGSTIEGTGVYTPYRRSELTGWAFAMGIPAPAVDATAREAGWLLAGLLLAAVLLAIGLAALIGARISRPIAALAAAAGAIREGRQADFNTNTRIKELRALRKALRNAEAAVRERQKALTSADRAKDEFLAILGHELRNPLAALTAAAHVLKVAPQGGAADKARAVLERQTRQMTRLIEDLLDISRISMGKAQLERSVFSLPEFVDDVLSGLRASSPNPIRFTRPGAPVLVEADRARVEQILANLLDNAVKFSRAGEPITVEVRAEDGAALLRVSDRGQGIAPEQLARIFELFVQGEHGPDRIKSGLGLGLALARRLAEMHGGTITVESPGLGRGSTFTVRLPSAHAIAEPRAGAEAGPAVRERRILIVDDNEDVRESLRSMLALDGHQVHEAGDGATGLALVKSQALDVALIDIGLPDLDGYELARRLKAEPGSAKLRLVAVTGLGQPEDRRKALEAGFDAHLTKPVRLEQLNRAIAASP